MTLGCTALLGSPASLDPACRPRDLGLHRNQSSLEVRCGVAVVSSIKRYAQTQLITVAPVQILHLFHPFSWFQQTACHIIVTRRFSRIHCWKPARLVVSPTQSSYSKSPEIVAGLPLSAACQLHINSDAHKKKVAWSSGFSTFHHATNG